MGTTTMEDIADHLMCAQEQDSTFTNYVTIKLQNLSADEQFLLNFHL